MKTAICVSYVYPHAVESDLYDDEEAKYLSVMEVDPDVLRRNVEQMLEPKDALQQCLGAADSESERLAHSIVGVHLVVQRVSSPSYLSVTSLYVNIIQGGPAKVRPTYMFDGNI